MLRRYMSAFLLTSIAVTGLALAQAGASKDVMTIASTTDVTGAAPGGSIRIAVTLTIKEPWHINAHKPLDKYLIPTVLTIEPVDGITVESIAYPDPITKVLGASPDPLALYEGETHIGAIVRIDESVAPGELKLAAKLGYQPCDDSQCLSPTSQDFEIPIRVLAPGEVSEPQNPELFAAIDFDAASQTASPPDAPPAPTQPETVPTTTGDWKSLIDEFEIAGQAGGYMDAPEFLAFVDAAESGQDYSQSSMFEGRGVLAIVALTLVGGLALNLTPCVLPLIPINLAIIGAGAKSGSRSKGFALGGVYGLGIALLYGALGLIAVLGAGSFGTINASPWFNFAIAIIFVVLALAMFDVILIDFTRFQSKLGIKKEKGSFVFAFIMGAVNALLAGACVAPVVIAVILYSQDAYTKGATIALALPFILGVGMALPWPFAGGGLALMPKPGTWMVRVKQAFGVFILGMALYYGYIGYDLFSNRYLADPDQVLASAANKDEEGWVSSLDDALAIAQKENKPVVIDFWATWCKNCLAMNVTTFKDPEVVARLDKYVKVKYQAESPEESPAKDVLSHFEYVGLPHYAILKPKN